MIWKAIQQVDGTVVAKKGDDTRLQLSEKLIWEGHARDEQEVFKKAKRECRLLDLDTKTIQPEESDHPDERVPYKAKRRERN